ncbi:MAG: PAS domain S-box protein [Deltaproteobacteria bacterium]|nr:PAS domain S-box protein [Deltaproteobacteria bacterium]
MKQMITVQRRFRDKWGTVMKRMLDRKGSASSNALNAAALEQIEIYESMIQNCAVAIFAVDINHKVIHWNRACEGLTGVMAQDVLGTRNHWKPFYGHKRPCLSDILIKGDIDTMPDHYSIYGPSVLLPDGLHAEGWYPDVGGRERYIIFDAAPIYNKAGDLVAAIETLHDITQRKRIEEEREKLNIELKDAFDRIRTLSGLIPICAGCKKIRDDKGYWNQLEQYLEEHSDAVFSHGLCPECFQRYFPDAAKPKTS